MNEHEALTGQLIKYYESLVEKPEGKRPFEGLSGRMADTTKMPLL
jgi:hypothetical protein